MSKSWRPLAFSLFVVAAWELVFQLNLWPEFLFPSPQAVLSSLVRGFADKTFLVGILTSMKRILLGYGVSLIVGTVLGLLLGNLKALDEAVGPFLSGLGSLPSICWLPLGLLWFGLNERAILFVVLMGATFSVASATTDGVKNISPIYLRAASTMGSFGLRRYVRVILPAALPSIVNGMKQGWAFAWRSLMAGEMLFVSLGLGHLLMVGRELNDISQVLAVMIVIVAISVIVDKIFIKTLESGVRRRWGLEKA